MIEFFKILKKFLAKKKKTLSGILAGMMVMSMIPTIVTVSIGLALFGAIGYYVTSFEDKKEEEEDDSARVASASDLDCNCTLVYDGKQFVNGYDSSILNGTGANINSGSTGSSTSSGGAGMTNSKGESTAMGEKIAQTARNQPEITYVYGGSHSLGCENTWKNGADCSSETYYNLKEAGIVLNVAGVPTSTDFRSMGTEVASWDELLPGDIICAPGHVCTYVGNNEIWNSGKTGTHSSIISADYYKNKYVTIRRFVTDVTVASSSNSGVSQSSGNFKKFNLTDEQIKRIIRCCFEEQGTDLIGVYAEASMIANYYDIHIHGDYSSDVDKWLRNEGWFYSGSREAMDKTSKDKYITTEMMNKIRALFNDGRRGFPNYIDEHDTVDAKNAHRDGWVHEIKIDGAQAEIKRSVIYDALMNNKNVWIRASAKYTGVWIWKFKDSSYSDPFGYQQETYDKLAKANNIVNPLPEDDIIQMMKSGGTGYNYFSKNTGTTNASSNNSTNTGIGAGIIGNNNSTNTGIGAGIINNSASTNTGITGSTGGLSSSASNKLGKYIDNPDGMPLYDGYTFDSSKVEYFDLNYKQFWDGTTPQDDWLYNLGNFNEAYDTNQVTFETRDATVRRREVRNGEVIEDGRWVMASPMRILALDDPDNDEYWERSKNPANYNRDNYGNTYDPNICGEPNKYIGYSQGVYYDVVLDDGSVLPMISGDAKAMHYGDCPRSTGNDCFYRCDKSLGYAHIVAKPHQKDVFLNQCIFEVCGNNTAGGKQAANLLKGKFLKGKKVVSIRVYKNMYRKQSDGVYTDWFSSGTDSSFGLTGGQADSSWISNGTSSGSTGSTGTALTGTNGALKFNSDGTICINCTCEGDCKCHSASADSTGGSTGSASGSTGSSGSATISKKLESVPGVPQGIYYNWTEQRQYTSDEIYSMFKTQFPNLFNQLQPTFGTWTYYEGNEVPITYDGDRWTELFGEIGIVPYDQCEGYWTRQYWHINVSSGRYLDSVDTSGTAYFGRCACGLCARAIVASTMLHRIITPTECLMAIALSPTLSSTGYKGVYWEGNPYKSSKTDRIYDSFVYKGQNLFNLENADSTNEAKIDEVLSKGGMVIGVTHNTTEYKYQSGIGYDDHWTGGGHYIVITGKDSNGLYRETDSSGKAARKNPNAVTSMHKGHTLSEWHPSFNQITYVTPGPGYAAYIKDVFGKDI